MKKRIFYVINLDKGRIITISFLFGAFICASFITGYHMGTLKSGIPLYNAGGDVSYLNQKNFGLPVEDEIKPDQNGESDYGKSYTKITKGGSEDSYDAPDNENKNEESKTLAKEPEKKASVKKSSVRSRTRKEENKKNEEKNSKLMSAHKESPLKTSRKEKKNLSQISKKTDEKNTETRKTEKSENKDTAKNPKSPLLSSSDVKLSNPEQSETTSGKMNSYSLQVGAFNNKETAERMKLQLAKDGFSAYIISSGEHHKVRVGRSLSEEKSISMESRLRSKNFGSVRIKE